MLLEAFGAKSIWGPLLCGAGAGSLALAMIIHGIGRWPTILPAEDEPTPSRPPSLPERISVHLIIYGVWAVGFGAVVWRGPPAEMVDVRFRFEREWPVWESAEWVYLSVYFVPAAMPWLAPTRAALRRYALNLWWLLLFSLPFFLTVLASPPRSFTATSFAGWILQWETGRPDFAAASLPSFHVFWGLLVAQLLSARGRIAGAIGWSWAVAVTLACVAAGTHAIADLAVSWAIFPVLAAARSPVAQWLQAAADRLFRRKPNAIPITAPSASPPSP